MSAFTPSLVGESGVGIIWSSESNVWPESMVRFDPKTKSFQSWSIFSGGVHAGIVRHMPPTRDSNLLIQQSIAAHVTLVNSKGAAAMQ